MARDLLALVQECAQRPLKEKLLRFLDNRPHWHREGEPVPAWYVETPEWLQEDRVYRLINILLYHQDELQDLFRERFIRIPHEDLDFIFGVQAFRKGEPLPLRCSGEKDAGWYAAQRAFAPLQDFSCESMRAGAEAFTQGLPRKWVQPPYQWFNEDERLDIQARWESGWDAAKSHRENWWRVQTILSHTGQNLPNDAAP